MAYAEGVIVSETSVELEKEAEADIIKGKVRLIDFCRSNDLKQTDVEK